MNNQARQKKIAIISSLYMPHLGGVEKYSQSLARTLTADYEVHVFCMNTESVPAESRDGDIFIHALPCGGFFKGRLPVPTPKAIRRTKQIFRETGFDFGIIQTRLYPFNLQAAKILKEFQIPFFLIEHGSAYVTFGNSLINRLWEYYERHQANILKRYCSDFYAVSQASLDWLNHFGIQGKGIIHNSIDPREFEGIPAGWRKSVGIPSEAILLTFAGRIIQKKGIVTLLTAAERIEEERLHIIIAGDGDETLLSPWKQNSRIHFLGKVPHRVLLEILKDSQLFCLPTTYPEGLPTVILEAGYFGVPVIATDMGGINEVISDNKTGKIIPADDPESLRSAILELIRNEKERNLFGSELQKKVSAEFTWQKTALEVKKIIESV
ncbi:MAG TPA: glycosyltransferase family 4 protein [Flexilinea sp.]|nr:glycosyltransferase family 4 protein [Flexilinea sp.]